MTKLLSNVIPAALILASMGVVGCNQRSAKRIETGGPGSIRTIDQIDDQDWAEAAERMVASIIDQGIVTGNTDGTKRRLAVSRIINNSGENVDIDLLVKRITVALNKSGKVVTSTIKGSTGIDDLAKSERELDQFEQGEVKRQKLDYTLSGKLISNRSSAGAVRQSTFYFQLSLTDKNGDAIWEDQAEITKQGSKNAFGL